MKHPELRQNKKQNAASRSAEGSTERSVFWYHSRNQNCISSASLSASAASQFSLIAASVSFCTSSWRTAIVVFADLFIFQQCFHFVVRVTTHVKVLQHALVLLHQRTILVGSLRRSSVSGGSGTRMSLPAEFGFRPRSDAIIVFSTAGDIERSKR